MEATESTTAAAQFETLDERTQADLEHEAWSEAVEELRAEQPDVYERLEAADAWDDMELEVYEDEHGRRYFHKVTGVVYSRGDEAGQRLSEAAHEFLNQFRDELESQVQSHDE
jgi:hypothetical protein